MPYDIKLVAYNPFGDRIGELPQPLSIESADPLSDAPSMTVKYSKHSIGAEILKQPVELAREVYDPNTDTWFEPHNGRFLNIRTEGDQLDSTGALNYVLPGFSWLLSKTRVYPLSKALVDGQIQDATVTEGSFRDQLNDKEDQLCVELKKSKNTQVVYGETAPPEQGAIWVNTSSWDATGTAVPYLYINNTWEEIWDGYVQGDPTGQVLATEAYAIYLDHQVSQGQLRDVEARAKRTKRVFSNRHPGHIMATLIAEAQGRGERLTGMTFNFTTNHDSAGNPWPAVSGDVEVNVGGDLLKVLLSFVRSGALDFRTNGRTLEVFVQNTAMSRNNTANAVFRYGVHIDEAPDRGTWENLANEILFVGDEGLTFTRDNPEAPRPWGVWESSVSQSGVSTEAAGDSFARGALEEAAGRRVERTRALIFRDDIAGPLPYAHYLPGDYIMAPNSDGEMESQRIEQITLTKDGGTGQVAGNIVLNDRFIEREIRNQRTTEALTNGTTLGGTGGARESETYVDLRTPEPPRYLKGAAETSAVKDAGYQSVIDLEWYWGARATNGTDMTDGAAEFQVQYRLHHFGTGSDESIAYTWRPAGKVGGDARSSAVGPLDAYSPWGRSPATYDLRVRVLAHNGRVSSWSTPLTMQMPLDDTPPARPARPTAKADGAPIYVAWSGLNEDGGLPPVDLDYLFIEEAAIPADAPFTYAADGTPQLTDTYLNSLTWVQVPELELRAAGSAPVLGRPYGDYFSYRLVAVDMTGNESERSAPSNLAASVPLVDDAQLQADLQYAREQTQQEQAALDAKLTENTTKLTAAEADIADLDLRTTAAQQDLDIAEAALTQAQTDLDAAEVRIGQAETDLAAADQRIATEESTRAAAVTALQTKDSELETDLAATEAKASKAASDLILLDTRLDTAETDLAAAESNISALTGRTSTAEAKISSAETRLTTAETNISDTAGELATLDEHVGLIETRVGTVETVAAQAQTDAAAAGSEAEAAAAAAAEAQRQVDILLASSNSLLIGGDFETEQEGYNGYRTTVADPYSGSYVIGMPSDQWRGITFPKVGVRPGMILQGRVVHRSYPGNTAGTVVSMRYTLHRNDGTTATEFATAYSGQITGTTWAEATFDFPEIPADVQYISPGIAVTGGPGNTYNTNGAVTYLDSAYLVDTSDYRAAVDAANAAQAEAEAATQRANDAYSLANTAQQAANGKNFVVYQLTEPQGVGLVDGDTWYQVNDLDQGIILAQWSWSADANEWVAKQVDGAQIANFDAGYITSGYLDVANRIAAGSISADKVLIGVGHNLFPNGDGTQGPDLKPGSSAMTWDAAKRAWTYPGSAWYRLLSPGVALNPLSTYRLTVEYYSETPGTEFALATDFYASTDISTGYLQRSYFVWPKNIPANTWQTASAEFKPADLDPNARATSMQIITQHANGAQGQQWFRFYLRELTDGALVVNGTITGQHVDAESVAAEVGEFVQVKAANVEVTQELSTRVFTASDAAARNLVVTGSTTLDGETWARDLAAEEITAASIDVEQLQVTGTGSFNQAVVDQLWADTFASHKVTTEELLVGSGANLYVDPLFEHPEAFGSASTYVQAQGTGRTGGGSFLLPASTAQRGAYAGLTDDRFMIPVTPGGEYRVGAWVRTATDVTSDQGTNVYVRCYNSVDGTWVFANPSRIMPTTTDPIKIPRNVWTLLSGIVKVPETADRIAIGLYANSAYTEAVRYSDPFVQQATGSVLISNGAVTAEKVSATSGIFEKVYANESVTARKGVFTDGLQAMDPTFLGTTTADALNLTGTLSGRDAILTGSLDVAQLNVTESMATEIFTASNAAVRNLVVTGSTTLSGETWARDLAAEEITAATIKVDQLTTTGSANMSTAVAEEFWARKIAAKKILATEVIIGSGYNLVTNGYGEMQDDTNFSRFGRNTTAGVAAGTPATHTYWTTSTSGLSTDNYFTVVGGKTYKGSAYMRGQYDGQVGYMQIRFYGADGSYLSNPSPWTSYFFSWEVANSDKWYYYEGEVEAPAGAVKADVVLYGNHSNGVQNASQWHRWAAVEVVEKTDGSLIVDGSISTRHIDAETFSVTELLSANEIEAQYLRVDQIKDAVRVDSNLFVGQTYYGGKFILRNSAGSLISGAEFATHASSTVGVHMNGSGIKAYKNNVQVVDINTSGNIDIAGTLRTGAVGSPGLKLVSAASSYNGDDLGIWFTRDGSTPGWNTWTKDSVGGIFQVGVVSGASQNIDLQLRPTGDAAITIWEQLKLREMYSPTNRFFINQGTETMWQGDGRLYLQPNHFMYLGNGTHSVHLGQGYGYNVTTTAGSNVFVNADTGELKRVTSRSDAKLDQQLYEVPDTLLDLPVKDWIDRGAYEQVERMRSELSFPLNEVDQKRFDAALKEASTRIPGVIAEEAAIHGAEALVQYDDHGEITGFDYSKLAVLLLPFLRELWQDYQKRSGGRAAPGIERRK